jgi:integrase/recombinase XerD
MRRTVDLQSTVFLLARRWTVVRVWQKRRITMNRRSPGLKPSRALQGFINYKFAAGLSPRTIDSYERDLKLWLTYQEDIDIAEITSRDLRDYLIYLRTEYTPRRLYGNNDKPLSPKTIRNHWISLSAFFSWACMEFEIPNPMKKVPAPKYKDPPVTPFTKDEVWEMLKACDFCEEAKTDRRRRFTMRRSTAKRDRALILVLLDTGLRATELCSLRVDDVDLKTGRVDVKHGAYGGAKGGKGRVVFLGKVARGTLWRYLAEREDGEDPEAPLFVSIQNRPLNKDALRLVIKALGEKAGVKKCYPHLFRHTFAIQYLRAGGDVFTLQMLLGHSTLDMVRRYARLAEVDLERAHRKASPADSWRL